MRFKLRGQTIALPFKSLYVLAPDGPGQILGIKLERAIRASPTTSVVMSPENAEAVIEIIGAITEKGICHCQVAAVFVILMWSIASLFASSTKRK